MYPISRIIPEYQKTDYFKWKLSIMGRVVSQELSKEKPKKG